MSENISVDVPDGTTGRIDADCAPDESSSDWLREAIELRLAMENSADQEL